MGKWFTHNKQRTIFGVFGLSETSPGRSSDVMQNLVKIGGVMCKYVNKDTLLYILVTFWFNNCF
jgi:hypothetical protein